MTKADLIDEIAARTEMKKKDAALAVDAVFNIITEALIKHEKVQIVGFGAFEPRQRHARIGRDPRTQKTVSVPASWSLAFRPSKQLKNAISGR